MVRRSPLIILLSVEIMLNGANLLLIAFSRLHGHEDGQIFAISVMAVAASEVVVGLGLIVAHGPPRASSSTSTSSGRSGDEWRRRLGLPAAAARRRRSRSRSPARALPRRGAGYISTATTMGAFVAAAVAFVDDAAARSPGDAAHVHDLVDMALGRPVPLRASRCSPTS